MPTQNILSAYQDLPTPREGNSYSAEPFPSHDTHRLAKTKDGYPAILVRVPRSREVVPVMPVRLEVLQVDFDVPCRIRRGSGPEETGNFAVIVCQTQDLVLIEYFLHAATAMLVAVGDTPSKEAVARSVIQFVRLFRALAAVPSNTAQGLWAELFLIVEAQLPQVVAAAWHSFPGEKYDFSVGSGRVEVKSASGRDRKHHFSLEQLETPPGTNLLIVSISLERSAGGLSLADLIREVAARLQPELATRIREVAAETLGQTFQASLMVAFDRQLARSSMRYCWSTSVPRIPRPLPAHVNDVRFTADLIDVQWVASAELNGNDLFAALPLSRPV
jgi:hypothetical protein